MKFISYSDNESLAIIVKDNPELSSLSMPRLTGIVIEEFDPKVALDNNPKLFQSTSLEQSRYEGRTTTSLKTMNKILLGSPSYVSPRDQKGLTNAHKNYLQLLKFTDGSLEIWC